MLKFLHYSQPKVPVQYPSNPTAIARIAARSTCAKPIASLMVGVLLWTVAQQAAAIDTRRYFPIDLGATWATMTTPVPSAGDPLPSYTTVSTMVAGPVLNGRKTSKLSWSNDNGDTERTAGVYVNDSAGTQLVAVVQMAPDAMRAECLPRPSSPHFILPGKISVGQIFSGTLVANCDGAVVDTLITTTVLGFATTTVPAGKFRTLNFKRVVDVRITWPGKPRAGSKEISVISFAKDVGLVKDVTESFFTGLALELTETEVLVSTNRKYDPLDQHDE